MKSIQEMVTEFHVAMGQTVGDLALKRVHTLGLDGTAALYTAEEAQAVAELLELRTNLVSEEIAEYQEAEDTPNLVKEMADIVYVLYGLAVTFGIDLDEAVRRVHASNMSKLDDDGKPIRREDGKVLKGPNYAPPFLDDLVSLGD